MKNLTSSVATVVAVILLGLAVAWAGGWVRLGGVDPDGSTGEMAGADHSGHVMPAETRSESPPTGAVMIAPDRQSAIGLRTALVRSDRLVHEVRTVGIVEYDERLIAHIHTKVEGWIDRLVVDFTGKLVEQDQPLLEIYSPELVATQEEYLLALRAQDTLGVSRFEDVAAASRSLLASARRRLELWDITDEQIAALERRGEPRKSLTLYSPIAGYVIHKAAYEGQYVGPRDELFTIADLSRVWLTAEIYERDIPRVEVGQEATVTLSHLPGRSFRARVDYVYPYMEPATRTLKVRFSLENPGFDLKPEMFARVAMDIPVGTGLLLPDDAVIDTGERQVAFLVLPDDRFQPVEITVGDRYGDDVEVLAGLEEGATVVSGAAFLVDSESRLKSAMQGMSMSGHQH
jgi:RND family efflux transporter MFP subunit